MVSFMTSSPDRPQYYSHNVNVKCLISKTILQVKIFQWCYTLSNVLQIRKHIRVASLPAPFYRENSPNASKARGLKQCTNMYTYINKIEITQNITISYLSLLFDYVTCPPVKMDSPSYLILSMPLRCREQKSEERVSHTSSPFRGGWSTDRADVRVSDDVTTPTSLSDNII